MRFAIIIVMSLALGLFLALPLEDLPETAFDESQTQPLERPVLFTGRPLHVAARADRPSRNLEDELGVSSMMSVGDAERTSPPLHPNPDSITILDHSLRC